MARTTGSTELYKLIHSLTPNEKGNFIKYAKRHSENKNDYLRLFLAICKQQEFEEKTLRKKFKDLPVLKNYLFNMVLQSLITSGVAVAPFDKIITDLLRITVLVRKGLLDRALKLNHELKEYVTQRDSYGWLAMVLKSEAVILDSKATPREGIEMRKKIHAQINLANEKQQRIDEYIYQQKLLLSLNMLKEFGGEDIHVNREMNTFLLHKYSVPLSAFEGRVHSAARQLYYKLEGMEENAYAINETLYRFEKNKWKKSPPPANPAIYYIAATILIQSCFKTGRIRRAEKLVAELKPLQTANTYIQAKFEIEMPNIQLQLHWYKGEHKQGEAQSANVALSHNLTKDNNHWEHQLHAMALKALLEFSNKNYTTASATLNYFNQPAMASFSLTHKKAAEFLRLLIQIEIENYSALPALMRSIKNRFKSLSKAEAEFLKLVASCKNKPGALYREFEKASVKLELFDTLALNDWATAHLQKKPLHEIIRLKMRK